MRDGKTNEKEEFEFGERIKSLLSLCSYKYDYETLSSAAKGPINIALIKYWGKEDEERIIPLNNSISITLDMNECYTYTEAKLIVPTGEVVNSLWLFSKNINTLYLNNQQERLSKRLENLISYFRDKCENKLLSCCPLIIESVNKLPTAAGCASSASSMSCIVKVLSKIFLNDSLNDYQLSALARIGSGSACRSIHGGIVEWHKYNEELKDSLAKQVVDEHYWPELRVLLMIVSDKRKDTSSTDGMKTSKETSELLKHRLSVILPARIEEMKKGIFERNFEKICELTVKDSNNFHAICRDTYPTINYLNDTSNFIIKCVEKINSCFGKTMCGYTFDAGPNAFIIVEAGNTKIIRKIFDYVFNMEAYQATDHENLNNLIIKLSCEREDLNAKLIRIVEFEMGSGIQSDSLE